MSDEYQAKGLDALFTASPSKTAAVAEAHPQETETQETVKVDNQETDVETKADPKAAEKGDEDTTVDTGKLLEDYEKTNKRLKDSQKWGNEAHQKFLKAQEKLLELGEITQEEFNEAKKAAPTTNNDLQAHADEFSKRYQVVKDFLVDSGENPDELVAAFDAIFGNDPATRQEFVTVPPEKKVKYVLDKGREGLEFYHAIKKYGTISAALTAIKQDAAKDTSKTVRKSDTTQDENTQKPRVRLSEGGATVTANTYSQRPLTQLMERN